QMPGQDLAEVNGFGDVIETVPVQGGVMANSLGASNETRTDRPEVSIDWSMPAGGQTNGDIWGVSGRASGNGSPAGPTQFGAGGNPWGGGQQPGGTVVIEPSQPAASLAYLVERNGPRAGWPHLL